MPAPTTPYGQSETASTPLPGSQEALNQAYWRTAEGQELLRLQTRRKPQAKPTPGKWPTPEFPYAEGYHPVPEWVRATIERLSYKEAVTGKPHATLGSMSDFVERELGYLPSYWEDPQRIAKWYFALQSAPRGAKPPDFVDRDKIVAAYNYLKFRNGNTPWYEWDWLASNDPGRQFLAGFTLPPADQMFPPSMYYDPGKAAADPQGLPVPGSPEWDALPTWNKVLTSLFGTGPLLGEGGSLGRMGDPFVRGAAKALPTATVLGFAFAGLPGAAVGAGLGTLIGGGAEATLTEIYRRREAGREFGLDPFLERSLTGLLGLLQFPAVQAERAIGTGVQLGGAVLEPDRYGPINELLADIPTTYFAGSAAFEALGGRPVVFGLEWLTAKIEGREPHLPQPGEIWMLGEAQPRRIGPPTQENVLALWAQAVTDARDELRKSDRGLQEVSLEIAARYGIGGQLFDLFAQAVVDPLNFMPSAETAALARIAKLTDNEALAAAAALTRKGPFAQRGAVSTLRHYANILRRETPIEEIATSGWVTRYLGGVTKAGEVAVMAGPQLPGLLGRAFGLTPKARAMEVLSVTSDAMKVLFDGVSDPVEIAANWRSLAATPIETAQRLALRFVEAPDGHLLILAMRDFEIGKLDALQSTWVATRQPREMLSALSEITQQHPSSTLRLLETAEGRTSFLTMIRNQVDAGVRAGDQVAVTLKAIIDQGLFTEQALADLFKVYVTDGLPWHPEQWKANLYAAWMDHVSKWTISKIGLMVEPMVYRLNDMLKKTYSLLLLDLSVPYLIMNVTNNISTQAIDGNFRLKTTGQALKWWREFGAIPYNLGRAFGGPAQIGGDAGGVGSLEDANLRHVMSGPVEGTISEADLQAGLAIAKAVTGSGGIEEGSRMIQGIRNRVGFASKLSNKAEKWSGIQAFTSGTQSWWKRAWRRAVGFDRLPPDIEDALGADLMNKVYAVPEGSLNNERMRAELLGDKRLGRTVEAHIENVARAANMDPAHVADLFERAGATEFLNEALVGAKTPADVYRAFVGLDGHVQQYLDSLVLAEYAVRAGEAATLIRAGDFTGFADLWYHLNAYLNEWWTGHVAQWGDAVEEAATLDLTDPAAADSVYRQRMAHSKAEANRVAELERATIDGILTAFREAGVNFPERYALGLRLNQARRLEFFELRDMLWTNYFEESRERAPHTYRYTELVPLLDAKYGELALNDMHVQEVMDTALVETLHPYNAEAAERLSVLLEDIRVHQADMRADEQNIRRVMYEVFLADKPTGRTIVESMRRHMGDSPDFLAAIDGWTKRTLRRTGELKKAAILEIRRQIYGLYVDHMKLPAIRKYHEMRTNGVAELIGGDRTPTTPDGQPVAPTISPEGMGLEVEEGRVADLATAGTDPAEAARIASNEAAAVKVQVDLNRAVTSDELRRLARDAGIPTATKAGQPFDGHLVNVLNKDLQLKDSPFKLSALDDLLALQGPEGEQMALAGRQALVNRAVRRQQRVLEAAEVGMTAEAIEALDAGDAAISQRKLARIAEANGLEEAAKMPKQDVWNWMAARRAKGDVVPFEAGTPTTLREQLLQFMGKHSATEEQTTLVMDVIERTARALGLSFEEYVTRWGVDDPLAGDNYLQRAAGMEHPWVKAAVEMFGVMDDPSAVAGWLLPNGKTLKVLTHPDVERAASFRGKTMWYFGPETGSIRYRQAGTYAFADIFGRPTVEQMVMVNRMAQENTEFVVALARDAGTTLEYYRTITLKRPTQVELANLWAEVEAEMPRSLYQSGTPLGMRRGFYSWLRRTVEQKMPNRIKIDELRNLFNAAGVKPDELDWTGLDDYLLRRTTRAGAGYKGLEEVPEPFVTKDEVLAHLDTNEVQVTEVWKGSGAVTGAEIIPQLEGGRTQYDQYTLPGGSNYREVLYTLPARRAAAAEVWQRMVSEIEMRLDADPNVRRARYRLRRADSTNDIVSRAVAGEQVARGFISDALGLEALAELDRIEALTGYGRDYRSPHWNQDNVLAHARIKDRVLPDGRKTLFVEELQSDWMQALREAEGEVEGIEVRMADARRQMADAEAEVVRLTDARDALHLRRTVTEEAVQLTEIDNGLRRVSEDLSAALNNQVRIGNEISRLADYPPRAPFAKSWHEMVLKRLLRTAAEEGYDAIGWTTANQQAKRWNLVEFGIEEIVFTRRGEEVGSLSGIRNGEPFSYSGISEGEIADYIGEAAYLELMNNGQGYSYDDATEIATYSLNARDLERLGGAAGEGGLFQYLYEKAIPQFLSKYTKKWGMALGQAQVDVTQPRTVEYIVSDRPVRPTGFPERWTIGERRSDGVTFSSVREGAYDNTTREAAQMRADRWNRELRAADRARQGLVDVDVSTPYPVTFEVEIIGPPENEHYIVNEVLSSGEVRGVAGEFISLEGATKYAAERKQGLFLREPILESVHIINLTDAMKESVLYEGQRLFQTGGDRAIRVAEGDARAALASALKETGLGAVTLQRLLNGEDIRTVMPGPEVPEPLFAAWEAWKKTAANAAWLEGQSRMFQDQRKPGDLTGVRLTEPIPEEVQLAAIDAELAVTTDPNRLTELQAQRVPLEAIVQGDPKLRVELKRALRGLGLFGWDQNAPLAELRAVIKAARRQVPQNAKGMTVMLTRGRRIIRALSNPDFTTAIEEVAHGFRGDLLPSEMDTVVTWGQSLGHDVTGHLEGQFTGSEQGIWAVEEAFATGFVRYFAEGIAPHKALVAIFAKFKAWILEVIGAIQGSPFDVPINDEIRQIYADHLGARAPDFDTQAIDWRSIAADGKAEGRPVETPALAPVADAALAAPPSTRLGGVEGEITQAHGPDPNVTYDFLYRIMSLDDVIASHSISGEATPGYPKSLQPRDRSRAASIRQSQEIAARLNPDVMLAPTRRVDDGAPIIGPDGFIESGNGRINALKIARRDYPENFQAYRRRLVERARTGEYGIVDEVVGDSPVLVRERLTDVNRTEFVAMANDDPKLGMSPVEQARSDANLLPLDWLANLVIEEGWASQDTLRAEANREFLRRFVKSLPRSQQADVVTANGELNIRGIDRILAGLFFKVFGGDAGMRFSAMVLESTDPVVQNVSKGMMAAVADLALAEALIAAGRRPAELSISDSIVKAAEKMANLKRNGPSVEDYLGQPRDMFGPGDLSELERTILLDLNSRGRSMKAIKEMLQNYAKAVVRLPEMDQGTLFGPKEYPSRLELYMAAKNAPASQAELFQMPPQVEPNAFDQVPPAYLQSEVQQEAWTGMRPLITNLRDSMAADWVNDVKMSDVRARLDPNQQAEFVKWAGRLGGQMASTKYSAMKWGEGTRDWTMLNYTATRGIDGPLGIAANYSFWPTRTFLRWILRTVDRPSLLANLARVNELQKKHEQREGFPRRLKGRVFMPLPFLPEWMGGGVWVDPLRGMFPPYMFLDAFDRVAADQNRTNRKAAYIIEKWIETGDAPIGDGRQAIETQTGPVWDKALAQAQGELEQEFADPLDYLQILTRLSLPFSIAREYIRGTPERIGPLPITRTIKSITAPFGIGGPGGLNIEGPIRSALDLPSYDRFEDYRIERMLGSMVADGLTTVREADIAGQERAGPLYDEAVRRVNQSRTYGTYANPAWWFGMGGDTFPTGERELRNLQEEFGLAIFGKQIGDATALTRFFEKYPEYEARLNSFDNPEERQRSFLVDEVWVRYRELGSANKELVRLQLGQDFEQQFLSRETRNYGDIPLETLATWAQVLGGYVPKNAKNRIEIPERLPDLRMLPPAEAKIIDTYREARNKKFPNWYAIQQEYFRVGPPKSPEREDFLARFPQLQEYWDWRKEQLEGNEFLDAYYRRYDLENWDAGSLGTLSIPEILTNPVLMRQLEADRYSGQPLTSGALEELRRIYQLTGSPGDNFQDWIKNLDLETEPGTAPQRGLTGYR